MQNSGEEEEVEEDEVEQGKAVDELLDEAEVSEEKEEEDEAEDELHLVAARKFRRYSAMSIEGSSSDDGGSNSPPRMRSLQAQLSESHRGERSRLQGLGIHSSGSRIAKPRSRSTSPRKGRVLR